MKSRSIAAALLVLGLAGCAPSGPMEVRVAVTENGFEPATVTVTRGRPATLIITRKTDTTCATEAAFAETGRKYDLPLNTDVRIEVPTDQAGTIHYACGMDMYKGQIQVK